MSAVLPAEARTLQGEPAGLVSRVLAAAIDLIVVAGVALALVIARSLWRFFFGSGGAELALAWPSRLGLVTAWGTTLGVYLAWGWSRTGRTIGKRVLGLAVTTADGGRVSAPIAILRAALYLVFPIGLLWCAVSRRNRSLQDTLLGTAVVYDWHGARRRVRWDRLDDRGRAP